MKKNFFNTSHNSLAEINDIYLPQPDLNLHSLAQLKQNFKNAKNILQKTYIEPNKPAFDLPHYLVLGLTNSGKSTFIDNIDMEFLEHDRLVQKTPEGVLSTAHTNWWITKIGVFIDVPGHYLTSSQNCHLTEKRSPWISLLKLLKKHKTINGILLVVDIPSISSATPADIKFHLDILQARLQELGTILKYPLSIHLILSKIDIVQGFSEFFTDLGREEREQPWGLLLPSSNHAAQGSLHNFNSLFNDLLKRLNERVIWRLHQGHALYNKSLIKNFTLQIEALKKPIENVVFRLATICHYHKHLMLSGIFFSSSKQTEFTADFLLNSLNQQLHLSPVQYPKLSTKNQPFFIRSLIQHIVKLPSKHLSFTKQTRKSQRLLLSLWLTCFILTAGFSYYLYLGYQQQKQILYVTQQTINTYTNTTSKTHHANAFIETFSLLETFTNTLHNFQPITGLKAWLFHNAQLATLQHKLQASYQVVLAKKLFPLIQTNVEQKLIAANATPEDLYSALTVYLMLENHAKLNIDYVAKWLIKNFTSTAFAPQAIAIHLDTLFKKIAIPTIATKPAYIQQARHALNSLPEPVLIYTILKAQNLATLPITKLAGERSTQIFNLSSHAFFPATFTLEQYQQVFSNESLGKATIFTTKDPILETDFKKINSSVLIKTIQNLYFIEYIERWQHFIDNVDIIHFKDTQHALTVLDTLVSNQSPTRMLLTSLTKNLTPPLAISDAGYLKFAALHSLLQKDPKAHLTYLTKLDDDLNKLRTLLLTINKAADPDKQAFETAVNCIKNNGNADPINQLFVDAQQAPFPINKWYTSIASNYWQLILERAKRYIATDWAKSVLPIYKNTLENKFPLTKNMNANDMRIIDFIAFFEPNGVLDKFVKENIEPFVDTSQAQWTAKELHGKKLAISNETLLQFERASVISKMFFNPAGKFANNFYLELLAITPNIKNITLQLDQQNYIFIPGENKKLMTIDWQKLATNNKFSLQLLDYQGQIIAYDQASPWALLRFLKQNNLVQTTDTQHFEFEYSKHNYIAKFAITAEALINPFIPGVLEQLEIPESL